MHRAILTPREQRSEPSGEPDRYAAARRGAAAAKQINDLKISRAGACAHAAARREAEECRAEARAMRRRAADADAEREAATGAVARHEAAGLPVSI